MAHRNSWFTHETWVDFPVRYVNVYQMVNPIISHYIRIIIPLFILLLVSLPEIV